MAMGETLSSDESSNYTFGEIHFKAHAIVIGLSVVLLIDQFGLGFDPNIAVIGVLVYLTSSILEDSVKSKLALKQDYTEDWAEKIAGSPLMPDSSTKIEHVLNNSLSGLAGVSTFFIILFVEITLGEGWLAVISMVVLVASGLIARNVGEDTHTKTTSIYYDIYVMGIGIGCGFLFVLGLLFVGSIPEPDSGYVTTFILVLGSGIILFANRHVANKEFDGDSTLWHLTFGLLFFWGVFAFAAVALHLTPYLEGVSQAIPLF